MVLTVQLLFVNLNATERGFAVIIDTDTYNACKSEIDGYVNMLAGEGFNVKLLGRNWNNPQEVREELLNLYNGHGIEGAIFIGQIPIPMVRDAQYLTSAFKMDQSAFPMRESSVPSDRYYDDFDLKFDYIGQDSTEKLFHYFSLRGDSPQSITCDIYSGRLKPTMGGEKGYEQIRKYFRKLIEVRKEHNLPDVITTYTGEGSFSNSLTAWRNEGHILREQFPAAFKDKNSVKLLFYNMYPYMKETVINELRREDSDIMIFHEHGMPQRQYLSEFPKSKSFDDYFEAAGREVRLKLRKIKSAEERDLFIKNYMSLYNADSSLFKGYNSPDMIAKDSLTDAKTGILASEMGEIRPNSRLVIFDACYNGDFRENSYIGAEYIFADGKTVVTFGNSVNVLQDKSSSDLMGMLAMGFSVGEWARLTNILESHITGDPTFRFSSDEYKSIKLSSKDLIYWLKLVKGDKRADVQNIALHKLFNMQYKEMPELLYNTYISSPYYTVRLQCWYLLGYYNTTLFAELIKKGADDPYEFIRRKSLFSMGKIGSADFIPYLIKAYLYDNLDERVFFNSVMSFDMVDPDLLAKEFSIQLAGYRSPEGIKKRIADKFESSLKSRRNIAQMAQVVTDKNKSLKARLSAVTMLRNYPYHGSVASYLGVISDKSEDTGLRVKLAEALGWFTLSEKRASICDAFTKISGDEDTPEELRKELIKSVLRIKEYMR